MRSIHGSLFLLAVISLMLGSAATAQTAPAPLPRPAEVASHTAAKPLHLTLSGAVSRALEANPALRALHHRTAAAAKTARAASLARWGAIDAVASYSRFNDDWMVRPMSEELFARGGFTGLPWDRNQMHYGVTFEVPLYLGGTLTNGIKIARLKSEQTAALVTGSRWQVRFNATSLYTAAQSLDAVGAALDELIASLEKTRERLDLMVKEGKRPELDRLKVLEQYQDAVAQREAVAADRTRVASLLLALMGENPARQLEVDPLPDRVPALHRDAATLIDDLSHVSAIRRARLAVEMASSSEKIARGAFLPRVIASGNYMQNNAPSINNALDTWQFSVGVRLPLFAGGSRFERLGAAKENRSAALMSLKNTRLEVQARLRDALARFAAAQAQLTAARARVAAGSEAARIEQIRYNTGAGTIEDLLRADARREGAQAYLARARAGILQAAQRINAIVEEEAVK
ncbi:MAG: TolC family protein [Acidobacteria bacterium]|nr:TolC family protein [Acidobacteriota bacterium]